MLFNVRTLSAASAIDELQIDATDVHDARTQAESRGLFVSSIEPARLSGRRRAGRHLDLVLFSQELLALLNAGLSIVESLQALLEKEQGQGIRHTLQRILDTLQEGQRFSVALAQQPQCFPPLYVGIVQAAEGTSNLPGSLRRFINYQQQINRVRTKVVSAGIYPLILLLAGGAVSLFLMAYVVPRFAQVYEGAGRHLPWMSRLMLGWGNLVSSHRAAFAVFCVGLLAGFIWLARWCLYRGGMLTFLRVLPAMRERARIYELSRLYLTLGMLADGGISVVNALATVLPMATPAMRDALVSAKAAIEAGLPLSTAFESAHLTTPVSLRMLRVGERTGEMGVMLNQSASFYDEEIARWLDRFTKTLEPALMAIIGIVVGGIVVLLYMPIFDLAGDLT